MQGNLQCYITCKVWMFSGRIQNISFHFAQLILFITVGVFLTISFQLSYCDNDTRYHTRFQLRNILCRENVCHVWILPFMLWVCGVTCSLILWTRWAPVSTNQQLFKKNLCNQSSHNENYGWFNGNHVSATKSTLFVVNKGERYTKEGRVKSMKNALYVQQ